MRLPVLLKKVRACEVCKAYLPSGPRPLVQISAAAKILIIGQAPGRVAHESGIPWNDQSGDRLRDWLGVDDVTFYDENKIALMPMGFCFPGKGAAGDLAPRPECAPLWHVTLLAAMRSIQLTVYIGNYAISRYLGNSHESVTASVQAAEDLLPTRIVLPHPSPRNNIWLKKNLWFEKRVLPALRTATRNILGQ